MDKVFEEIKRMVDKATDKAVSKNFLGALGKILSKDIKVRTRSGLGTEEAKDGGRLKRLEPLNSEPYKKQRKRDKNLSTKTSPSKSNLTRTGQLLDSIISRVKGKKIEISFKEGRKPDKYGKTVKNDDIVTWQETQRRPFFYISAPEQTRIDRLVRKKIEQELKKLNN